jgi:crossover junction endodeoxyribonuclease RuvC
MNDTIRVIGIDPGLRRTGWGVVEAQGNTLRFVAAGTVRSNDKDDLASRLRQIHDGLSAIVHGRCRTRRPSSRHSSTRMRPRR